jgi:hypothetical protein
MTKKKIALIVTVIALVLVGGLTFEIVSTQPVRGALRSFAELFTVANRPDLTDSARLDAARQLCSKRYQREHPLALAPEGGLVNIPRNLHKNYKAWREGADVFICPTDRAPTRPIYRFVFEGDRWCFDGLVGVLLPSGKVVPAAAPAIEQVPDATYP